MVDSDIDTMTSDLGPNHNGCLKSFTLDVNNAINDVDMYGDIVDPEYLKAPANARAVYSPKLRPQVTSTELIIC